MTELHDTPDRLDAMVATLRHYDARMKGLAGIVPAHIPGGSSAQEGHVSGAATMFDWHWHREVMLPASLGAIPASLFDDPAVRLAFAERSLMIAGLVARALYARRSAVRRCIDRTVLSQLRVALGDGAVGHERLQRLQRLTATDKDSTLSLPEVLTTMRLAHDGLARLRRAHPMMASVVVHFVLMQLERAPAIVAEATADRQDASADRTIDASPDTGAADHVACLDSDVTREAATFFERLPHLIPELI